MTDSWGGLFVVLRCFQIIALLVANGSKSKSLGSPPGFGLVFLLPMFFFAVPAIYIKSCRTAPGRALRFVPMTTPEIIVSLWAGTRGYLDKATVEKSDATLGASWG